MPEFEIDAKTENLEKVNDYIVEKLMGCPMKLLMQIDLVVEEVFVNIASYAYKDKAGKVWIDCMLDSNKEFLTIVFMDEGVKFDPLERPDPDVDAPIEEREIGGLGIFLTKKLMDEVKYERRDGKNTLTLIKKL